MPQPMKLLYGIIFCSDKLLVHLGVQIIDLWGTQGRGHVLCWTHVGREIWGIQRLMQQFCLLCSTRYCMWVWIVCNRHFALQILRIIKSKGIGHKLVLRHWLSKVLIHYKLLDYKLEAWGIWLDCTAHLEMGLREEKTAFSDYTLVLHAHHLYQKPRFWVFQDPPRIIKF
jgi:hypothetical protein